MSSLILHPSSFGWRLVLLLAAVVFLVVVVLPLVPLPVMYRRYVSPPLPDGYRYTFLYPSDMRGPVAGKVHVALGREETWAERHLPWLSLIGPRRWEMLNVHESAGPIPSGSGPRWRRTSYPPSSSSHVVVFQDTQTPRQLQLYHSCPGGWRARFRATDPTVSASFQMLAPGAPVPRP